MFTIIKNVYRWKDFNLTVFLFTLLVNEILERQIASQYMYKDSLGFLLHENTKNSY